MHVYERILRYNAGRGPELAQRKFARMTQPPFVFLRGSCHLSCEDWHGVRYRGRGFVLNQLQPSQDRLDLAAARGRPQRLAEVIATMGNLVTWSVLRGSGRQGAANGDAPSTFARARLATAIAGRQRNLCEKGRRRLVRIP